MRRDILTLEHLVDLFDARDRYAELTAEVRAEAALGDLLEGLDLFDDIDGIIAMTRSACLSVMPHGSTSRGFILAMSEFSRSINGTFSNKRASGPGNSWRSASAGSRLHARRRAQVQNAASASLSNSCRSSRLPNPVGPSPGMAAARLMASTYRAANML